MSPRTFFTLIAILPLTAGVILLFIPLNAPGSSGDIDCGTAATPTHRNVAACVDARATRNIWAISGLALGGVILAGARFVRWTSTEKPAP